MKYCNYCEYVNTDQCKECTNDSNFYPKKEYKEYFKKGFCSQDYYFDTANQKLKETTFVNIGNTNYCPYCGEEMFYIQENFSKYKDSSITGYCCLCDGAFKELEYLKIKKILKDKHRQDEYELGKEYSEQLKFNIEKLTEIKHQNDLKHNQFFGRNDIDKIGKKLNYKDIF